MKTTIVELLAQAVQDKPTDGSDCTTLAVAQKELGRLRRITGKVVKVLTNAKDFAAQVAPAPQDPQKGQGNDNNKRRKGRKVRKGVTIDQSFKGYRKVTVEKSTEDRALIKSSIKNNALFREFVDSELENFVDVFVRKRFNKDFAVIQQGELGDTFYVVESGALEIFIHVGEGDKKVEKMVGVPYHRGGAFGELALLYQNARAATIRVSEDCVLWEISRMAFKGLQLLIEMNAYELRIKQIQNVKIGSKLLCHVMDLDQIESMAMATKYQSFPAGSVIVKEGEEGNTFYIITQGDVDVYKKSFGSRKIATLGANSFFGEKALSSADMRQATCVAASNVDCLTLNRDDFVLMLGNLEEILMGSIHSLQERANDDETCSSLKDAGVTSLDDLKIKRVLGEGAFGKVNLVKSRKDGRLFALKAQSKDNVIKNGFKTKLVTEYRVMRALNHPFVVECFNAFQDKKYIFFVMGLLPGGEVFSLIDKVGKFPETWTRFYCGTVVLVFEYIHQQKIAYRDLKPENLVLDEKGYCHVIDFGLAKKCDGKTWTMCGTPDYLAPEIITGKGHDWAVDYWALGVLLYELTHGLPPFYDDDPTKTAKKVMKRSYAIPQNFSRDLVDLVSQLLTDQSRRLGRTKGGVRTIKKHPWFSDFDWQGLLDCEMMVPCAPEIENLEKIGTKDNGKWDAPETDWIADLSMESRKQRCDILVVKKETSAKKIAFR